VGLGAKDGHASPLVVVALDDLREHIVLLPFVEPDRRVRRAALRKEIGALSCHSKLVSHFTARISPLFVRGLKVVVLQVEQLFACSQ